MENQKLHNAKLLGGIGSILMLLIPVPAAGGIIAFVGLILVLVAVKYVADELNDHDVFTNYLLSFIVVIIAIVVFAIVIALTLFSAAGFNLTNIQNPAYWQNYFNQMQTQGQGILQFILSILAAFVLLGIILIVSAIFLRKSFNKIASATHTHMFQTAGLIYLIGAALTIIFIGLIIIFVAFILQIIAFFSLPETLTPAVAQQPMQQGMPPQP